jgi:hypothetical protein
MSTRDIVLTRKQIVASAYSINESDICESQDKSPHENYYDDGKYISTAQELNINLENSDLDSNQKEKFLAFLGKNRNVFAKDWSLNGYCYVFCVSHSQIVCFFRLL